MEKKESPKEIKTEYERRRVRHRKIYAPLADRIYLFWDIDQLCLYLDVKGKTKGS